SLQSYEYSCKSSPNEIIKYTDRRKYPRAAFAKADRDESFPAYFPQHIFYGISHVALMLMSGTENCKFSGLILTSQISKSSHPIKRIARHTETPNSENTATTLDGSHRTTSSLDHLCAPILAKNMWRSL
uniref:Uncharacterized protein n=1 Tax=Parascaris univalens TaxID=6257 RepID=A0A915C7L2_PARUN